MVGVRRSEAAGSRRTIEVVDGSGTPVPVAARFLAHLAARGCSPNTVLAYGYDLGHLWRFLDAARLDWGQLTPERAVDLLIHLRATPARRAGNPARPCSPPARARPLGYPV